MASAPTSSPADTLWKEAMLAEYAGLRAEILSRFGVQQALTAANLTLCIAIVGFVVAEKVDKSLLLGMTYLSAALGAGHVMQAMFVSLIGAYIRNEWTPRMRERGGAPEFPSWESHLMTWLKSGRRKRTHSLLFAMSGYGAFLMTGSIGLVMTAPAAFDGKDVYLVAWIVGAVALAAWYIMQRTVAGEFWR